MTSSSPPIGVQKLRYSNIQSSPFFQYLVRLYLRPYPAHQNALEVRSKIRVTGAYFTKHENWPLSTLRPAPSNLRHPISRQQTRAGVCLDAPGASISLCFLSVARYRQFLTCLLSLCSACPPPPPSLFSLLFSSHPSSLILRLISSPSRLFSSHACCHLALSFSRLRLGLPLLSLLVLSSSLSHPSHVFYDVFIILIAALGRRQPQLFEAVVSATMRCARMGETTRLCRIRSRSFLRRMLILFLILIFVFDASATTLSC